MILKTSKRYVFYVMPLASILLSSLNVQVEPRSSEVTTDELLRCGHIISHNLKALEMGLLQMMELSCGVVRDKVEGGIICGILRNASKILAITIKHASGVISSISEVLSTLSRCINNVGHWHELPVHLREIQDHNRRFHELWPQTRDFLVQELLPALSEQLYSSQRGVLPGAALWVARLTRSEQFVPRLQVWGQLPDCVAGICAAIDPIPVLLDKVETYTVDLGKRLQVVLSNSSNIDDAQILKLKPALRQLSSTWEEYRWISRCHVDVIEDFDPSIYVPPSILFS